MLIISYLIFLYYIKYDFLIINSIYKQKNENKIIFLLHATDFCFKLRVVLLK
jgi:hypothetical protein